MHGEEQQQEVLTRSLGQRYRQGTVKVERAEPGNGGLTKFTQESTGKILSPETVRGGCQDELRSVGRLTAEGWPWLRYTHN